MPLAPLAPGVMAWLQHPGRRGHPNAGVVVDADGTTVVDTLMTPDQYEPFATEVEALGLPVRRIVLTGSSVEQAGGTGRLKLAAVYGSRQASVHLDQPPNVASWRALYPGEATAFDDVATRPVSHVVTGDVQVSDAVVVVVTGGQMAENLVALVPGAQVLFAGAMCSFGAAPLCWQGDPARWADELDRLLPLAPIVVPGHGPIGGDEEVRALQAYLRACVAAGGDPAGIGPGPWDGWADREHDVVNVERAALLADGDDTVPTSMLRLAGLA
ncbi:MAG TPA: MBL fold metallo-hydrolase [Acidimicrobiales bacterium]|nr:MBL fold metallo-hydrolase [Acidimicrobiales bacterium]